MRLSRELLESAYKVPSPGELAVKLSGRGDRLTKYTVDKLRKDFLTLMKNLKRVKSYQEADRLRQAVGKYRDYYERIIYQVGDEIDARLRIDKVPGLRGGLPTMNPEWAKAYKSKQEPIWKLRYELGDFPLEIVELSRKHGRVVSHESAFKEFQQEYPKWEKRTKVKAREAWKWLYELVAWTERGGLQGGGEEALPLEQPGSGSRNVEMEGFSVRIEGTGDDSTIQEFREGLKFYKQRAKRLMPWLLRYKLPFVLLFGAECRRGLSSSAAATYAGSHVNVNACGASGKPSSIAQIIAHEMGHHLFKNYFSDRMRRAWESFVSGYVEVDLRDVMAKMKPGEDGWDFSERLKKEDPLLSIRLRTLFHHPAYKDLDIATFSRIRRYLDNGGDPVVRLAAKPITGYAAKSPEEGFCEALGLLVGYGPRALLPEVRAALQALFPTLKIEHGPRGGAVSTSLSSRLQEVLC